MSEEKGTVLTESGLKKLQEQLDYLVSVRRNEISEQIDVSVSTVKKHIYNIFNKAGVNSRTQLLNLVFSLVEPRL